MYYKEKKTQKQQEQPIEVTKLELERKWLEEYKVNETTKWPKYGGFGENLSLLIYLIKKILIQNTIHG